MKGRNGTVDQAESLKAELKELSVQRAAITQRMDEIKAALDNCATCCDNAVILAFINLREEGMTWENACRALKLKPSTLRTRINQRFTQTGRWLNEPWAKDLPHRERLIALIHDSTQATLKFSLLTKEQFKETVTQLTLPEKLGQLRVG